MSGKREAVRARQGHGDELADLQERLYAAGKEGGKRSLLLVLQAMDTAGKGGIVRHVVGDDGPAGRAPARVQGAHGGGARARLPLADPRRSCRSRG